jgi:hypothetical protein
MRIAKQILRLRFSFGGPDEAGWLPPGAAAPKQQETTLSLRIEQGTDGFYLISESTHPDFGGGDTWHETLEDALHQAEIEFGVKASDWED